MKEIERCHVCRRTREATAADWMRVTVSHALRFYVVQPAENKPLLDGQPSDEIVSVCGEHCAHIELERRMAGWRRKHQPERIAATG